ncbi:MAG: hypothetical protein JEY99_04810 [Spirochaetales bacterium]|nr:hypothetical protein [Spirochaetales bacterium]
MKKVIFGFTTIIFLISLFSGCTDRNDIQAPEIIDSDQLIIVSANTSEIKFSWNSASDNSTSDRNLEYMLYSSDVPLPDLDSIIASGEEVTRWYPDLASLVVDVSDIDFAGTTYFNLVVKDNAENKTAYSQTAYIKTIYTSTDKGYLIETVPSTGIESFYYELDLTELTNDGESDHEIYYLFTNGTEEPGIRPEIEELNAVETSTSTARTIESNPSPSVKKEWTPTYPVGIRGLPETLEKETDSSLAWLPRSISRAVTDWPASEDVVGKTDISFQTYSDGSIEATCRAVITKPDVQLNIWVADDCWEDSETKAFLVDETKVNAMADAFLKEGEDKIYEWITGIFGDEWGEHDNSSYIGNNDEITILLYDIDGDGGGTEAPYDLEQGYYTAGYFWSEQNRDTINSNQRIMFFIDAPVYACPDNSETQRPRDTWAVTNYYPQDQISTLAHEFQHMINFYQNNIREGYSSNTDTWLNEMCSMIAEDLVSDKMAVTGPRGIPGTDYTEGDPGNTDGRIPLYNYYNDDSLTSWDSYQDYGGVLMNYSSAYSFGAYLARNYGGAELFKEIVQNNFYGTEAVTDAVNNYSGASIDPKTFEDLLADWGTAVILSDNIIDEEGFQFNRDSAFPSNSGIEGNNLTYSLGAVNFNNFDFLDDNGDVELSGPWYYQNETSGGSISTGNLVFTEHEPASNIYCKDNSTAGKIYRRFTQGSGVRITLIVKE